MSNDKSTPTSSSVWGKLDEKPSETPPHTPVIGEEKWGKVFGDKELKFNPDKLHPMTEKELKALEEANQYYGEVLAEMARKERN
ncbi:MAG: hypothetical protein ACK48P_04345 [Holosporales bacterium]|jgi:hypothetical protein